MAAELPEFWDEALAVIEAAPIGFFATEQGGQPRLRPVTPTYEGVAAYIATDPRSLMARHVRRNPKVELVHWTQDFRQLHLIGEAIQVDDQDTLERMWDAFAYELADYFGDDKLPYGLIQVRPARIWLTSLQQAAALQPPQDWRAERLGVSP